MFKSLHLFAVAVVVCIIPASSLVCDGQNEITTASCTSLLNNIERALLQDESNLSRMRRAFFHSPTASPVLIKVDYNLTFAENITFAMATNGIPYCSSSTENSTIDFKQQNTTYGWTSSGVYTAFHPIVLNMMQAQAPFAVLNIIHKMLNQRGPEADTFLWDGSYNLPTLHLNIHITSLPCVPSKDLLFSVLKDFNTLLKVYAGRQEKLKFQQDQAAIGFTIPSTSVSTNIDPHGSDVTMAILYSSVFCFIYLMSLCHLLFWYIRQRGNRYRERHPEERRQIDMEERQQRDGEESQLRDSQEGQQRDSQEGQLRDSQEGQQTDSQEGQQRDSQEEQQRDSQEGKQRDGEEDNMVYISEVFENNRELIGGMLMTAIIAIAFEFCTRIANCIVWTVHRENSLGNFLAVWLPQLFLFFFATLTNTGGHIYICIKKWQKFNDQPLFDKILRMCMSKVHAILTLQLTVFGLLYCFFPAIILIFIYPTRMIANFTLVPAYFFATTVAIAILIKFFRLFKQDTNDGRQAANENKVKILKFLAALGTMCLFLFFVYAIMLSFLYSVIIGSGSAVNTGPLFIASLIPSVFIMLGAWIANRIVLNGSRNLCTCTNTDSST